MSGGRPGFEEVLSFVFSVFFALFFLSFWIFFRVFFRQEIKNIQQSASAFLLFLF